MTTPRRRRSAHLDDLVEAILQTRGRGLAYRRDWHQALIAWCYFGDSPAGAERLARLEPPFDPAILLDAWREQLVAHAAMSHRGAGE